jgi:hypothetical protein
MIPKLVIPFVAQTVRNVTSSSDSDSSSPVFTPSWSRLGLPELVLWNSKLIPVSGVSPNPGVSGAEFSWIGSRLPEPGTSSIVRRPGLGCVDVSSRPRPDVSSSPRIRWRLVPWAAVPCEVFNVSLSGGLSVSGDPTASITFGVD